MKFTESVRICLIKKPFTFSGRGSRSEYWWFYLFVLISSFALQLLGNIGSIISFVITIPQFAASVRRLHDSNLSGWFIFVPITLLILTFLLAYKKAFVAGTIIFVICISISIYLYCRKSTPGQNRFGDVPDDILQTYKHI